MANHVQCEVTEDGRILMDMDHFRHVILEDKAEKIRTHASLNINIKEQKAYRQELWAEVGCLSGIVDLLDKYKVQVRSTL